MAGVAVLRCCTETRKGRSDDRNRPLTWVELRGFEPLTPSMRTRCATGLRYSPKNASQRSKLAGVAAHVMVGAADEAPHRREGRRPAWPRMRRSHDREGGPVDMRSW